MLSQESAAVQQIRTIEPMQAEYSTQFARYATQLAELGPPATGQASASAAGLIPGELAAGKKTGYVFALQGSPSGYVIHADPETYNSAGRRSFYSDESMVVRQNWGPEPATAQSPELR